VVARKKVLEKLLQNEVVWGIQVRQQYPNQAAFRLCELLVERLHRILTATVAKITLNCLGFLWCNSLMHITNLEKIVAKLGFSQVHH